MSVQTRVYWLTKQFILSGDIQLMQDELKLALLVPGYAYDTGMTTFSEVSALDLVDPLRYATGGSVVEGKSITTSSSGRAEFRISAMEWPYLTGQVKHAVIYANKTVGGVVNPLLVECDFGKVLDFQRTLFRFTWPEPLFRW